MGFIVVYDACVLYSAPLRDLLIRLANTGIVRARWSEAILDECFRSILANRPDLNPKALERTRLLMTQAVPDCIVTGFEGLVEGLALAWRNDGMPRRISRPATDYVGTFLASASLVTDPSIVSVEFVERAIVVVRGHRVILDENLAVMYQVETRALVQAVKRNAERFPADFMFQLEPSETQILRSQSVISSLGHGGRRTPPLAFTEQGVAMLSTVLRSRRALQVNIEIMRAFVRLRHLLRENVELARKLDALERKYDAQFRVVFDAIRELMNPGHRAGKRIGFHKEKT